MVTVGMTLRQKMEQLPETQVNLVAVGCTHYHLKWDVM